MHSLVWDTSVALCRWVGVTGELLSAEQVVGSARGPVTTRENRSPGGGCSRVADGTIDGMNEHSRREVISHRWGRLFRGVRCGRPAGPGRSDAPRTGPGHPSAAAPDPMITDTWAKRSSPPASGVMKPKPRFAVVARDDALAASCGHVPRRRPRGRGRCRPPRRRLGLGAPEPGARRGPAGPCLH